MAKIIDNIWVADFETVTVNTNYYKEHNDTKVLLYYTKELWGERDDIGVSIDQMLMFYMSLGESIMVYFHNLSFDGDFLLKWITTRYKMYNKLKKDTPGFIVIRQGSQIYEIKLRYYSKYYQKYYSITFRCSYRILSCGVETLGKSVGIDKYKANENVLDFYDVEPQDSIEKYDKNFVEYCKRDVNIVRLSLLAFNDAMEFIKKEWPFLNKFKWYGKLTASSISLKLQKDYVRAHYHKSIVSGFKHSNDDNEIASKFYFGGFTQFNIDLQGKEQVCKNGIGIDINSAHPYSMTKNLPYGSLFDYDEYAFESYGYKDSDVLEFYEIDVESAESIYGSFAFLANWPKYNKEANHLIQFRYLFESHNFKCYYMKQEWEILCKLYEITNYKITKRYWCFSTDYLKEFVNLIYKFKSDFKEQNKEGLSLTFKIILNSGYGIHAKRNDFDSYYVCENKEEFEKLTPGTIFTYDKKEYEVSSKDSSLHCLENQYIVIIKPIKKPKANNKFIASAITAYSRIYLWETMLKIGIKNCAYCDTDSIYIHNAPKDLSALGIKLDPYELGAWDIENEFTHIFIKGAKSYYLKNDKGIIKAKYSGISGKYLKDNLGPDLYKQDNLENSKLTKIKCKSGTILVWKDYKPKKRDH